MRFYPITYFLSEKVPLYGIPLFNIFNSCGKSKLSQRLMSSTSRVVDLWLKRNLTEIERSRWLTPLFAADFIPLRTVFFVSDEIGTHAIAFIPHPPRFRFSSAHEIISDSN